MLKNKKTIIGLLIFVIAFIVIYWFYLSKPTTFYSEARIKKIISHTYEGEYAKEIQDIIFIDQKHVFVPYISKENGYGVSFWKWQHHKWKIVNIIDKAGTPRLWKIKPNDPSSYVMFWNYNPVDRVNEIKFRLVRERNYMMSNENVYYVPEIFLEQRVSIHKKTYGFLTYPSNWSKIQKLEAEAGTRQNIFFLQEQGYPSTLSISMTIYDKDGKEVFPEESLDGNDYLVEDELFDFILYSDDKDFIDRDRNY
ncbi:hypothetical protein V7056_03260 [Bacillus sp. JJ664]